jgi:Na+-transporting NADH:ubiquinone oxidoreductase subunit NqrE
MEPQEIMDGISSELGDALNAMAKVESVDEKLAYSKIVKNLSESLGVFIDLASSVMDMDFDK